MVCTFILMTVSATFAFFTNIRIATISQETDVMSATTSTLMFGSGDPLQIDANINNFAENMDSLKDDSYAIATLKAGSVKENTTYKYNVNLKITENTFEYSTIDKKSELILTVTNHLGEEVTTLEGLEYKKVGDVTGFDITNKIGQFTIGKEIEIITNTEITHRWNVDLTFINHDESQDKNLGKNLNGFLVIELAQE